MVGVAGSACRVKGVKMTRLAKTPEWLDCHQIWCVVRAHVVMHISQVMGDVHQHVRACARADIPQRFISQERLDGLR